MSSDFTYAATGDTDFLAGATECRHTKLFNYRTGISFIVLADSKVNEAADTGWFPEPNRY